MVKMDTKTGNLIIRLKQIYCLKSLELKNKLIGEHNVYDCKVRNMTGIELYCV